jgi:hypothetical protein
MDKRGMEMSLNTVMIAVMALLVLAIIVFLLGKNFKLFNSGTSCVSEGGHCIVLDMDNTCASKDILTSSNEQSTQSLCKKTNEVCCRIVPSS